MFISIERTTIHMQTFYHSNKNLMYIYIKENLLPLASFNLRVGLFPCAYLKFLAYNFKSTILKLREALSYIID
jgi:hypothetical protein